MSNSLAAAVLVVCLGLGISINRWVRRLEAAEAATGVAPTPVFSPGQASPLAPAQVLTSGLIGCAAGDVAISEAHRGREGEVSWVASCLGRVLTCSSIHSAGPNAARHVYCAERRMIVPVTRPGQDI